MESINQILIGSRESEYFLKVKEQLENAEIDDDSISTIPLLQNSDMGCFMSMIYLMEKYPEKFSEVMFTTPDGEIAKTNFLQLASAKNNLPAIAAFLMVSSNNQDKFKPLLSNRMININAAMAKANELGNDDIDKFLYSWSIAMEDVSSVMPFPQDIIDTMRPGCEEDIISALKVFLPIR